jgi:RimJ/RimL family protein N-acetyltransferase
MVALRSRRASSDTGAVKIESPRLAGRHICLEPLDHHHIDGLVDAAAEDTSLYQWTTIPRGKVETVSYIDTALALRDAGKGVPFAIIRLVDSSVIGSTRFFDIEQWSWPKAHPRRGQAGDVCEIGYTWLARSAIRTAANTEAKLLMLTHAFETWQMLRVCFHTDMRNQRSRNALERIGGKFEGILRTHRMAADYIARDSARFSIVQAEWPDVKQRLTGFLEPA